MDLSLKDHDIAISKEHAQSKLWYEILVFLTAPFVFLFLVPREWDRMPTTGRLRLYQCYLYGINGDDYWQKQYSEEERRGWWRRTLWCWRNANVWDYENGVKPSDIVMVEHAGDYKVGNHPLVEGSLSSMPGTRTASDTGSITR